MLYLNCTPSMRWTPLLQRWPGSNPFLIYEVMIRSLQKTLRSINGTCHDAALLRLHRVKIDDGSPTAALYMTATCRLRQHTSFPCFQTETDGGESVSTSMAAQETPAGARTA